LHPECPKVLALRSQLIVELGVGPLARFEEGEGHQIQEHDTSDERG
jgi:hypothetical protein